MSASSPTPREERVSGPDPAAVLIVDYAVAALACNVVPHPAKQDGTKMPMAVPIVDVDGKQVIDPDTGKQAWGWRHRQTLRPSAQEVRGLFSNPGVTGFGVFTGVVSGPLQPLPEGCFGPPAPLALTMWEWEEAELFEACRAVAYGVGLGELFDTITGGYLSKSPGGGYHTFSRSTIIRGNEKLAHRLSTPEERVENPGEKTRVTIETRAQGGWSVEPPSHGSVHPSGAPYELVQGSLPTVVTISAEQHERFHDLLASFNETPDDETTSVAPPDASTEGFRLELSTTSYDRSSGVEVIEAYNARTTWESLLQPLGWTLLYRRGDVGYWRRPGKTDPGHSATTNIGGSDRLCVFSTSTEYQTVGAGRNAAYSKFAFYAATYHGGDNKAAVSAVAKMLGMHGRRNKQQREAGRVTQDRDRGGADDQPIIGAIDDAEPMADAIASAIERLSDLERRTKADPGVPFLPETLGALALLQERAPVEWARQRDMLKRASVPLRDLDRALKQERVRRSGFRVVESNDTDEPSARMAGSMVPDAPFPQLIIPPPYFIRADATGIVRQTLGEMTSDAAQAESVIAHAPLIITGRLRNADDGVEALRLSWRRSPGWHNKTVDRATAMNAQKLVTLADDGAPVTSVNAKELVSYLDALEAVNYEQLPYARISGHLGWQGERAEAGFLVGRNLILPSGEMYVSANLDRTAPENWRTDYISFRGAAVGDEQMADAYQARGTLEGWKNTVAPLSGHPRALLSLYGSFATPILEIVGGPNFIIDISNRTSTGKTTTLRVAASVWGNPDERSADSVIGSWDATRVWIERASSVLQGLPLFLDDTKRAKDSHVIADTLYAVANGRGRGRGNPRGLARTRGWRTILLSTGEAPATSFTQDGGTRMRVLSVRGAPFGAATDETRRLVDLLNLGVLANYGHAGPAFVSWLLENRGEWDKLTEMYQAYKEDFARQASSPEAGRLAQYAALLSMTARLVHASLELPWSYEDPLRELWDELASEASDAAGDVRALRDLLSWAYGHEATFHGRAAQDRDGNVRVPVGGWSGRWDSDDEWDYLGFLPTVLERVLREFGYEPAAILPGWAERGWLQTDDPKNRTRKVRLGGASTRIYAIRREAILEVDA